jgi:5'-3' exonuclease
MPAPLLIADLPWLLYRSFFAVPPTVTDAQGRPVNALLGAVNALLAAIEARPPRAVVACLGAEGAAYRIALYPAYHAQRDPMPQPLAEQWQRAPALLEALGWLVVDGGDLEADDVMYSFARCEAEAGGRALLLTGDRDLYQAVGEQVAILELGRGNEPATEVDPREVRRRYGVAPEAVPDFIALRGDPSDNFPGAPGIGAKTARDLLLSHGSLDAAIAGAIGERPRVAAALRDNAELLRSFRRIATLVRVDVQRPADRATDYAAGAQAAADLGMARLARRLAGRSKRPTA